jgi:hypothetical protein
MSFFKKPPLLPIAGALAAMLLLFNSPHAWAQNFGLYDNPYAPSAASMLGTRFITLLLAGVAGFAVGAFFSPALRALRLAAGLVLAGAVVLYALFGPFPIADAVNVMVSGLLALVAFGFGVRLGAKVLAAAAKARSISFGSAQ